MPETPHENAEKPTPHREKFFHGKPNKATATA